MDMLLQPAPLPEEMDQGYLGRIMRINGYRTVRTLWKAITAHLSPVRGVTRHELLSQMAGQTSEEFAQNHTLIPLKRAITHHFPNIRHGSPERKTLWYWRRPHQHDVRAFYCEECVKEDVSFHGVSYWRRDHQIRGQLWYSKHAVPLHYAACKDPFCSSPVELLGRCHAVSEALVLEAQSNPFVQRFLDLSCGMFERFEPMDAYDVVPHLRTRGDENGFARTFQFGSDYLMNRRIRAVFPELWLSAVFQGKAMPKFGSIMQSSPSTDISSFLLVLAVLFEDADEAINMLAATAKPMKRRLIRNPVNVAWMPRAPMLPKQEL